LARERRKSIGQCFQIFISGATGENNAGACLTINNCMAKSKVFLQNCNFLEEI
jgi:hypothetical protein